MLAHVDYSQFPVLIRQTEKFNIYNTLFLPEVENLREMKKYFEKQNTESETVILSL